MSHGNTGRITIRWELQQRELAASDSAGVGGATGKPRTGRLILQGVGGA